MPSEAAMKLATLMLRVGDPTGDTLASLVAKHGDLTETLAVILEAFAAAEGGGLGDRIAFLQQFIGKGTGTVLAANMSTIDAIGTDGVTRTSGDFGEVGILQYMMGMHSTAHILFVIPEAVGAINIENAAILATLQRLGEVTTITQGDALEFPDFEAVTLCVLGTDNPTAWVLANLADLNTVPNLPIICCDARTAAELGIGVDGGDAAAVTAITGRANIKGTMLGVGIHGIAGLAVGANALAAGATTFCTLDMSDADLAVLWFAYESVNANTDVTLGIVKRVQPDGTIGTDVDGADVPATMAFYGPAYSFNDLNTLGQNVLYILGSIMIHGATIGQILSITGNIGNLSTRIFGAMIGLFNAATPLVAFVAGNTGGLGSELPDDASLYDLIAGPLGVPTYPAAAVPGDGINIARVIRIIYDMMVNGTYGLSALETLIDEVETLLKDGTYGLSALEVKIDLLQADLTEGKLRAFKKIYTYAGTVESVANAAEVSLAAPATVSPAFPAGATLTRAVVVASIHAANIAENAHLIGLTLQRNIAAGGWVDVTGFAFPGDPQPMSLPAVIGATDAYTAVGEITFTTGQSIQFRWQVDSTNAGEVHYSQGFVLSVEYDFV